jgi:tetratricopeptide (TPR) repeat protein
MIVNFAGLLAKIQGDYEEATSLFEQNIRYYREGGGVADPAFISSLSFLSTCYRETGDVTQAEGPITEALAVARSLNLPSYIGSAAQNLAIAYLRGGRLEEARPLLEESLTLFRELNMPWFLAGTLRQLGELARLEGDFGAARRYYADALDIFAPASRQREIAWCLDSYGILAAAQGNPERAARLRGATEAIYEAIQLPYVLSGESVIVEPVHQTAWEQGKSMTWEEAVNYAREG